MRGTARVECENEKGRHTPFSALTTTPEVGLVLRIGSSVVSITCGIMVCCCFADARLRHTK